MPVHETQSLQDFHAETPHAPENKRRTQMQRHELQFIIYGQSREREFAANRLLVVGSVSMNTLCLPALLQERSAFEGPSKPDRVIGHKVTQIVFEPAVMPLFLLCMDNKFLTDRLIAQFQASLTKTTHPIR